VTNNVDTVIVGAGLAGFTLAWQLKFAGKPCSLIDDDRPGSASKVAAGLVTPVTGQRFVPSWRYAEFWPVARAFYRRVEAMTGATLLHETGAIRLLTTPTEAERAGKISRVIATEPPYRAPYGLFVMPEAARLDVPRFLDVSRSVFDVVKGTFEFSASQSSKFRLILCQGDRARTSAPFNTLRWKPAKGEILTLRIPGLRETRVVHAGIWIAPKNPGSQDGIFVCGATYEWLQLDDAPTPTGRAWLEDRLQLVLDLPYEVIGHAAAVRPILDGQRPVVGWHPEFPQVGILNGLGSKGTLLAPLLAYQLVHSIVDPQVDVSGQM
jgi:glycine oxidase